MESLMIPMQQEMHLQTVVSQEQLVMEVVEETDQLVVLWVHLVRTLLVQTLEELHMLEDWLVLILQTG